MNAFELREKTCCFTGHRALPLGARKKIARLTAEEIRRLILQYDVCYFGVGGAQGYDTLAAKILFRLKKREFPHIKVILVYPFEGFTQSWPPLQRMCYQSRLKRYDKTVCVSKTAGKEAFLARNRHLIAGSAYCISYCTQTHGGTAYTLRYARCQGVSVRNIAEDIEDVPI